jgi:hypothetical protein
LRAVTTRRSPETYVHASGENLQRGQVALAVNINPALAGREVLALDVGDRSKLLAPWDLVEAIDEANGNKAARSIYRRLYVPLSNYYTVHASGGTLLRHVHRKGSLRWRPFRAWARRSPARVADAAAGFLAADLAQHATRPYERLLAYADKHICLADPQGSIKSGGSESSPERAVLTVAQVFAFADAIALRYRALVLLATFTSLRWGNYARSASQTLTWRRGQSASNAPSLNSRTGRWHSGRPSPMLGGARSASPN